MLHPITLAIVLLTQGGILPGAEIPPRPAAGKVVAKVNGVEIRASDLEPFLWEWKANEALSELIQFKVLFDEATKLALSVTDKEVEDQLAKDLEQYKATLQPGQKLEDALAAQGLTQPRLRLLTRYNLLLDKIALKDFSPGMFVNVSTILIRPNTEQAADVAAAIKKADDAYARLGKGEAWSVVLKSVASDPRMAQNDGSIGWRSLNAFPATVAEELKMLAPGKHTKPAQTQFGIQIFRIDAKGESLKGEDLEALKAQYLQSQRQAVVNRLQSEAKIERFLGK